MYVEYMLNDQLVMQVQLKYNIVPCDLTSF